MNLYVVTVMVMIWLPRLVAEVPTLWFSSVNLRSFLFKILFFARNSVGEWFLWE